VDRCRAVGAGFFDRVSTCGVDPAGGNWFCKPIS